MNKRCTIVVALLLCGMQLLYGQTATEKTTIAAMIRSMSIEEKVGQMTQVDLGVIAQGDICNLKNPQQIDPDKLRKALAEYHVGSVLNVGCGSGAIDPATWRTILTTIDQQNKKLSGTKYIPVLYGIDAIHGANYTKGATLFPQQLGQAATWNPELVKQANSITAYEVRATGIPWNFSPVLDLGRQPLWSRFFETYGEDVCLARSMSRAAIEGLQAGNEGSKYQVAACMKHFLGYSMPLSGRDRTPAWISERELREYFLPTFQEAINAGAKSVMINSGEINGVPVHANADILTRLLRDELGFKGVAVTDWEDINKLVAIHHVAATKKEAVKMAILAGIDMSMTPNDFEFTRLLIELVKEGAVPESRIDESVYRILQMKKELGLFDAVIYPTSDYPLFASAQHAEASYQAAAESITLLKNQNNVLPLQDAGETVLVCGPGANNLNFLNGAWTHTWQGVDTTYRTPGKLSIYQSIVRRAKKTTVLYAAGSSIDSLTDLSTCLQQASNASKIIVCLAEKPSTEVPGNINSLALPKAQVELVKALLQLKKPVILVCSFNRPLVFNELIPDAAAILYTYLPGDEGGRAIADCLFGDVNPSGKLPFTYPMDVNAVVHYDHKVSEDLATDFSMTAYRPPFDFGYGLSYTTFSYSDLRLSATTMGSKDSIQVSVDVKNSGTRAGKEVVQLYYKDEVASITPSVKRLLAFRKILLSPGQTQTVTFAVRTADLSFVNKALERVTEPGEFQLMLKDAKKTVYVKE